VVTTQEFLQKKSSPVHTNTQQKELVLKFLFPSILSPNFDNFKEPRNSILRNQFRQAKYADGIDSWAP
jgi:hypothetical protein